MMRCGNGLPHNDLFRVMSKACAKLSGVGSNGGARRWLWTVRRAAFVLFPWRTCLYAGLDSR